ncbi:MAG TPA: hypothetical protein VJY62_02465 [Bacteroidia bacterium]|nr:hypothetical protein [Bacteroidia bacterium]
MGAIITKRPFKTVVLTDLAGPTPTPVDFKWNAVSHPVEYEFQRRDFEIVTVTDGGGGIINVIINADLTLTPPTAGDLFYVGSGPYDGAYALVSHTIMAPNTLLRLQTPFLGNTFSGYVNWYQLKPQYYIEVTIMANENYPNSALVTDIGKMRVSPDSKGIAIADVSAWLKKRMAIKNRNNYQSTNFLCYEYESFVKFWIFYREVYKTTGSLDAPLEDVITGTQQKFFATNSVRQISDKYGANLGEFVPVAFDADVKAKFISDFAEPTYFGAGFPFDIGVIISDQIYQHQMVKREWPYNQNGVNTGVNDTTVVPTYFSRPGEYRLRLTQGYGAGVSKVEVALVLNGYVTQRYVNQQYVTDVYTEIFPPVPPFGTPFICTERRMIRVKEVCYDQPVYIAWKGSEGAWSYYLFYYRQFESPEDKILGTYQPNMGDLETTESITKLLQKSRQNKVIIGATGLDENDIRGLWKMLDSPEVQFLVGFTPANVPIWQGCIITPGKKAPFDTRIKRGDIEYTLELPERLTLTQ